MRRDDVGTGGTSKTGKVHHYYKCGNAIYKKSCDKKTVKKDWIERHIVMLTRDFVVCDKIIDRLADAVVELQKQENTTIPFLQKQLNDIEKRIGNLINSIEEGIANASVKQRLDDLEGKKADIEIALAKEKIAKTLLTKEQIVFWIGKFKDGDIDDPAYRRAIVDIFVNSIFLYDDKLVITYNWKDGTKAVSLAELESTAEDSGKAETLNFRLILGSYLEGNAPAFYNEQYQNRKNGAVSLSKKSSELPTFQSFNNDSFLLLYEERKRFLANFTKRKILPVFVKSSVSSKIFFVVKFSLYSPLGLSLYRFRPASSQKTQPLHSQ